MKKYLLLINGILTLLLVVGCQSHPEYHSSHDWFNLPDGLETFGNGHGDVAVDSKGFLYVSVESNEKAGGIQVYDVEGKYSHNVPNAPIDFHGFVINNENGQDFIYGAGKSSQDIFKLDLKGKVILKISGDKIPAKYKKPNKKNPDKPTIRLTSTAVAPNGDIYTVDGYGLDYIHHFDKQGNYINTYGGREAPYNFSNCHNITIDTRYTPARILCCVRKKDTLVHLKLNGDIIGEYAKDLRRPSSLSFYKDNVAVAEINGRVTVLNKAGEIVSVVSVNDTKIIGHNKAEPAIWENGIVHSPHGIVYDKEGNLFVTEYNKFGRVHRFELKK